MSRRSRSKLRRATLLGLVAVSLCASLRAAPAPAQSPASAPTMAAPGPGIVAAATGQDSMFDRVRDTASDLVMSAMTFLGVPYRRGGTSVAAGFDCSGFTRHVFEQSIGRLLPRQSRDQALAADLLTIRREELKPGDLVFFNTMRRAFSHVGIYVGDGKFIHAPRTGSEVRVDDMRQAYWTQRFNGARRLPELEGSTWRLPPLLPSAVAAPRSAEAESASPR